MGRTCAACDEWRSNSHFSYNQWTKGLGYSCCKDCVIGSVPRVENPTPPPHTRMVDRSHPQLQVLDDLRLTYNGWEADVCKAEDLHLNFPTRFDCYVDIMQRKQKIHMGDRSHPQLQALDNMKRAGLTYNGWEDDVREAEDYHVRYPSLFGSYVEKMRRKQAVYVGDRSHPQLQTLDSLKRAGLTYNGWENDVREAEDNHVKYPITFSGYVEGMRKKQAVYVGDRSHPQLQVLDNLRVELAYNGWEEDVCKAENYHVKYPTLFDKCVRIMRSKQTSYSSQQNAQSLAAQVSPIPHQPRESDHDIKETVCKKARRIDDRQNQMAEIQENEKCVVCWSSKRTHAFFPCGHMCVCNGCADTILRGNSKCPLCRMVSRQIAKIYQ